MLSNENGKQLSRSVYINNLKKYNDRKNYGTSDNLLDRLECQEEAQSDDDNISVSDQSGNEDATNSHTKSVIYMMTSRITRSNPMTMVVLLIKMRMLLSNKHFWIKV